jgi:uncharacterized integral membrane protein
MWKQPKVWVPAILVLFLLIVILQNTDVVTLRVLFWQRQMSQVILLPLVLTIGFVLGFVVAKLTGARRTIVAPVPPEPPIP